MQEKVNKYTANEEDAVRVVQELEEAIENKKKWYHMVSLLSSQIFQKFKKKKRFVSMILKFNVSKSTIMFKNSLVN